MAVAFDNSVNTSGSSQVTLTTGSFTVGSNSNRAVAVLVIDDQGTAVSSLSACGLTLGGATLALAGTAAANGGRTVRLYKGVAPSSGSQTGSVTFANGDATRQAICVITLDGVDQTTPTADYTTATGTSTAPSVTVPNVTADDFVVDGVIHTSLTAAGANQTERMNAGGHSGASTQDGADGGVMSWSASESLAWAIAGVRFVAASGGGGETITLDKWLARYETRARPRTVMVPSGMTPPDRND